MSDLYLAALRDYERDTANAFEVIRRARARLRTRLDEIPADAGIEAAAFTDRADPTEPNGAELVVANESPAPSYKPVREQGAGGAKRRTAAPSVIPPAPTTLACDQCDRSFTKANALAIHRGRAHKAGAVRGTDAGPSRPESAGSTPAPRSTALTPLGADVDKREIDETCPRGCGRIFRWEPSLMSHIRSCDGKAVA